MSYKMTHELVKIADKIIEVTSITEAMNLYPGRYFESIIPASLRVKGFYDANISGVKTLIRWKEASLWVAEVEGIIHKMDKNNPEAVKMWEGILKDARKAAR